MSMTGKIMIIDSADGYGFIEPDEGSAKVFVHADDFGPQWQRLRPGTVVRFSIIQGFRGLKAYNVTILARRPGNRVFLPIRNLIGRQRPTPMSSFQSSRVSKLWPGDSSRV